MSKLIFRKGRCHGSSAGHVGRIRQLHTLQRSDVAAASNCRGRYECEPEAASSDRTGNYSEKGADKAEPYGLRVH